MSLKFENGIPGTLMVTRVASGNRGVTTPYLWLEGGY